MCVGVCIKNKWTGYLSIHDSSCLWEKKQGKKANKNVHLKKYPWEDKVILGWSSGAGICYINIWTFVNIFVIKSPRNIS